MSKRITKATIEDCTSAAFNGDLDGVTEIVDRVGPAVLNRKNKRKQTSLYCAARNGHADIVEYALEQGATVDCIEANKSTPLHAAAFYNHADVALLLLRAGANRNKKNVHGSTAADEAREEGHNALAKTIDEFVLEEEDEDVEMEDAEPAAAAEEEEGVFAGLSIVCMAASHKDTITAGGATLLGNNALDDADVIVVPDSGIKNDTVAEELQRLIKKCVSEEWVTESVRVGDTVSEAKFKPTRLLMGSYTVGGPDDPAVIAAAAATADVADSAGPASPAVKEKKATKQTKTKTKTNKQATTTITTTTTTTTTSAASGSGADEPLTLPTLPTDILEEVFEQLDAQSLGCLSQTCKALYNAVGVYPPFTTAAAVLVKAEVFCGDLNDNESHRKMDVFLRHAIAVSTALTAPTFFTNSTPGSGRCVGGEEALSFAGMPNLNEDERRLANSLKRVACIYAYPVGTDCAIFTQFETHPLAEPTTTITLTQYSFCGENTRDEAHEIVYDLTADTSSDEPGGAAKPYTLAGVTVCRGEPMYSFVRDDVIAQLLALIGFPNVDPKRFVSMLHLMGGGVYSLMEGEFGGELEQDEYEGLLHTPNNTEEYTDDTCAKPIEIDGWLRENVLNYTGSRRTQTATLVGKAAHWHLSNTQLEWAQHNFDKLAQCMGFLTNAKGYEKLFAGVCRPWGTAAAVGIIEYCSGAEIDCGFRLAAPANKGLIDFAVKAGFSNSYSEDGVTMCVMSARIRDAALAEAAGFEVDDWTELVEIEGGEEGYDAVFNMGNLPNVLNPGVDDPEGKILAKWLSGVATVVAVHTNMNEYSFTGEIDVNDYGNEPFVLNTATRPAVWDDVIDYLGNAFNLSF